MNRRAHPLCPLSFKLQSAFVSLVSCLSVCSEIKESLSKTQAAMRSLAGTATPTSGTSLSASNGEAQRQQRLEASKHRAALASLQRQEQMEINILHLYMRERSLLQSIESSSTSEVSAPVDSKPSLTRTRKSLVSSLSSLPAIAPSASAQSARPCLWILFRDWSQALQPSQAPRRIVGRR